MKTKNRSRVAAVALALSLMAIPSAAFAADGDASTTTPKSTLDSAKIEYKGAFAGWTVTNDCKNFTTTFTGPGDYKFTRFMTQDQVKNTCNVAYNYSMDAKGDCESLMYDISEQITTDKGKSTPFVHKAPIPNAKIIEACKAVYPELKTESDIKTTPWGDKKVTCESGVVTETRDVTIGNKTVKQTQTRTLNDEEAKTCKPADKETLVKTETLPHGEAKYYTEDSYSWDKARELWQETVSRTIACSVTGEALVSEGVAAEKSDNTDSDECPKNWFDETPVNPGATDPEKPGDNTGTTDPGDDNKGDTGEAKPDEGKDKPSEGGTTGDNTNTDEGKDKPSEGGTDEGKDKPGAGDEGVSDGGNTVVTPPGDKGDTNTGGDKDTATDGKDKPSEGGTGETETGDKGKPGTGDKDTTTDNGKTEGDNGDAVITNPDASIKDTTPDAINSDSANRSNNSNNATDSQAVSTPDSTSQLAKTGATGVIVLAIAGGLLALGAIIYVVARAVQKKKQNTPTQAASGDTPDKE